MHLKNWKITLVIMALLSIVLLGLSRTLGSRASRREEAVTRIARPGVAFWGEPVDVEVRIDANGLPSCAAPADVEPIYAVLVLDHSGSMAGTPLAEARNAASDFADLMNLTTEGDAVAVVMFDDTAELPIGLSHDRGQVVRTIQDILEGGGTDIAAGLDLAAQPFSAHPPPADARRVIILLSDGEQTEPGDPIAAADRVKAQGIRVVSIALGDADRSTLAQIASSEADYYETADPATLMEIYGEIAAGMVGTIATDVTLTEYFDNTHFTLINTGLYRAQQTDDQIVWRLPFVGRRGRSVGYFLRPRSLGWHRISPAPGQMGLTDCKGNPLVQTTPVGPHVLVLFPVWLLYIAPALAGMWLLYRLIHALRRQPPRPVGPPKPRPGGAGIGKPVKKKEQRPRGADITHGRPTKPKKR